MDGGCLAQRGLSIGRPSGVIERANGGRFLRDLADSVAHEVRNPLTAILGYVELAERDGDGGSTWVRGIRREVRRIDHAIQELYELAGPVPEEKAVVELNEVVTGVAASLAEEPGAPLADVRVEMELGDGLPEMEGDPDRLRCAVEKVLLEAGETVSPDRSAPAGRMLVSTAPAEDADPPAVTITVTAEGARPGADPADGMPAGDAEAEDPAVSSAEDGVRGLILALTRKSVEKVGGTVEVERLSPSSVRYGVTLPTTGGDVLGNGKKKVETKKTSKEHATTDEDQVT